MPRRAPADDPGMRRLIVSAVAVAGMAIGAAPAAAQPYSCGQWSNGRGVFQTVVQQGTVSCRDAVAMTYWWSLAPARQVSHRWPGRFWWCYDTAPYVRATTRQVSSCAGLARSLVAVYAR